MQQSVYKELFIEEINARLLKKEQELNIFALELDNIYESLNVIKNELINLALKNNNFQLAKTIANLKVNANE